MILVVQELQKVETMDDHLYTVFFRYDDMSSAILAVEEGDVWGAIEFRSNFSRYFLKRMWSSIDADQETLNGSSVNVK